MLSEYFSALERRGGIACGPFRGAGLHRTSITSTPGGGVNRNVLSGRPAFSFSEPTSYVVRLSAISRSWIFRMSHSSRSTHTFIHLRFDLSLFGTSLRIEAS